ncbi:glycosyltransferase family 9 protein [Saccharomonospora piscinae]|uniref:glycosyltransferase family 9 protein n=1 Tax=Saccharomonospora piscinae TaxID=687388 RepID=UPI0004676ACF|nr:glycosyltransferase family 9 protein [Saccharomonospora piscinae]
MAVTLVLRALGLGDLLTAVPALRALRDARPGDRLVLAAPAALAPLAALTGAVDEVLPTPGLGALRPNSVPRPVLAVNLHGRGPRSIADLLRTRPRSVVTHRHAAFPALDGPPWRDDVHEVRRWCDLLRHSGIAADPARLELPPPPAAAPACPAPGAVVVHPGAASRARRWPPGRFAAVARALADQRTGPGARVVVTGSEAERPLATEVAARAGLGHAAVRAGGDLTHLAALVAGAALVVCGDTGVGHLATAFGTPSVLLFGPTPPARWGPPPDRPRHVALWAGEAGDPHAPRPDPGLLRLTVPEVTDAALTLLVGGVPCRRTAAGDRSPSESSARATSG